MIAKDGKMFADKEIVAEKLNQFFIEAAENLDIERFSCDSNKTSETKNIEDIPKMYELHPNITKIKENILLENKFSFDVITSEQFQKLLLNLDTKKAGGANKIPVKMLTKVSDIASYHLSNMYDNAINFNEFPPIDKGSRSVTYT